MTLITEDNFKDFLNTQIFLEICCYSSGMMYPEKNLLIGMNSRAVYLKSIEDDAESQFWHWEYANDKDCSMSIYPLSEYVARHSI